jgi:hypothetical protein
LLRVWRGEHIWQAHRGHFYQRARDGGWDVLRIVGHVAAVNIALVALAAGTVLFPAFAMQWGALAGGGILVGWLLTRFARGKS